MTKLKGISDPFPLNLKSPCVAELLINELSVIVFDLFILNN